MSFDSQVAVFERGHTAYQGTTIPSSATDWMHPDWEGKLHTFPDTYGPNDPTNAGTLVRRSEGGVKCICVRNYCVVAAGGRGAVGRLYPGDAVVWKAGAVGKQVDGLAIAGDTVAGYVDDHLPRGDSEAATPTGGVAPGDLFWLIVKGPVLVLTPLIAAGFGLGDTTVGSTGTVAKTWLSGVRLGPGLGLTALTSGATGAGRLAMINSSRNITADATGTGPTYIERSICAFGMSTATATAGSTATNTFTLVYATAPLSL